jgi:hypothetical protein
MNKRFVCFFCILPFTVTLHSYTQDSALRWPEKSVQEWYNKQPWYCGFNYIPGYTINYAAIWGKTTIIAQSDITAGASPVIAKKGNGWNIK